MIALSVLYVTKMISEEKLPKQLVYGYNERLLCNCTCQNSLSHILSPRPSLFSFAGEEMRANESERAGKWSLEKQTKRCLKDFLKVSLTILHPFCKMHEDDPISWRAENIFFSPLHG